MSEHPAEHDLLVILVVYWIIGALFFLGAVAVGECHEEVDCEIVPERFDEATVRASDRRTVYIPLEDM